jgi:hypothetical protein
MSCFSPLVSRCACYAEADAFIFAMTAAIFAFRQPGQTPPLSPAFRC